MNNVISRIPLKKTKRAANNSREIDKIKCQFLFINSREGNKGRIEKQKQMREI